MTTTVLSSFSALIWQTLQDEGQDPRGIFIEAGLNPDWLADGNARYDIAGMTRLWSAAEQASKHPNFGVSVGQRWSAKNFHALGFAWLASPSALDALQRFQRYGKLINDAFVSKLWVQAPLCHFEIDIDSDQASTLDCSRMAAVSMVVTMLRQLLGHHYSPVRVELPIPRPDNALLLENHLGCPVYYQTESVAVVMHLSDCEKPIIGANPELLRANEKIAEAYIARIDQADIKTRTECEIITQLPSGSLAEAGVANALALSVRTLQRQLKDSGVSFSGLVQSVRKELAKNYILDSRLSLTEITYLLGFSDPANFSRAFKRWFGCSPSDYRKRSMRLSA
ncbi:MAG: AraC family transcriptional regulator [Motiliproteus sp.]